MRVGSAQPVGPGAHSGESPPLPSCAKLDAMLDACPTTGHDARASLYVAAMTVDPASLDDLAVPRSTGEIISDAVAALRRTFAVLFTIAVPFCAVEMFLREAGLTFLARITARIDPLNADLTALQGAAPDFAACMGLLLGAFFVQALLSAAVMVVGDDLCHGRVPTARGALVRLGERGAAVLVTSLLFVVAVVLAFVVVVAGGVALGFAVGTSIDLIELLYVGLFGGFFVGGLLFVVLTLRWSLYAPATVVEGRLLFGALRRSAVLTDGRGLPFFETPKFRLSVLLLVGLALSGVLQSLFVAPRLIMAVASGWDFTTFSLPALIQMPIWFIVPFGLVEVVTNALVAPFTALLLAFFAWDLRVRYEGVSSS